MLRECLSGKLERLLTRARLARPTRQIAQRTRATFTEHLGGRFRDRMKEPTDPTRLVANGTE